MKIRFVQPCELEVVTSFNEETEEATTENEIFHVGDTTEVDVVETNENFKTATIQFGDGSVAYGVPMMLFEVVEN